MVQRLKHLPAMWETWVRSLGREDPLEKAMATHSSILAWRIPWMEELGGLQSTGRKELDTTEQLHFHFHLRRGSWEVQVYSYSIRSTDDRQPGLETGVGRGGGLLGQSP